MLLLTELKNQEHATRTGVQDQNKVHELPERIVDEWDKLEHGFIDKNRVRGERQKTSSLCGCRRRTV